MPKTSLRPPIRKDGDGHRHSYSYSYKYTGYSGYRVEKRPRKLNTKLLLASIVFLAVGGPALYFWHDYQIERLSSSMLLYGDEMAAQENWDAASDAYFRVWEIRQDPKLLGKFAPAYDKVAVGYNRIGVIGSYQRAIGALPDRVDLRNRLSELLLLDGQTQSALEQAEKALTIDSRDVKSQKWRALALLALRRAGQPHKSVDVLKELKSAYIAQQQDFDLANSLTTYLREDLRGRNGSELAQQADAVMNRLVSSSPENANAYLARYRYRVKHELDGSKQDIDQAILLAPNNAAVIQQGAWDSLRDAVQDKNSGDYLTARQLFLKLIELRPDKGSGYLGLGDAEYLIRGDIERAIEVWQSGRQKAGDSLPLLLRIAEGQTNSYQYDDAEETLAAVDKFLAALSSRGAEKQRNWATGSAALFRGKIHLARNEPYEAISHLGLAAQLGSEPTTGIQEGKSTAYSALNTLGETYSRLGQWKDAAASYDRALQLRPESEAALLAGAEAWAKLGDLDRAVSNVERALRVPNVSNEANRDLAAFLLEAQLAAPKSQRNWTAFESAFKVARKQLADSWQLRVLDVDYSIRRHDADLSRTLGKLLSIEQDFPSDVEVWRRLPFIYESIGQPADTDRTLNRLEEITSSSPATKLLLVDVLLGRGQVEDAQVALDGIREDQLLPFEVQRRDLSQLRIVEARGESGSIDVELEKLINRHANNSVLVERFLERRLSGSSTSTSPRTSELLAELKKRQAKSKANWQYYEARIELDSIRPDMKLVRAHFALLRNQLPYWSRTQELAGRIALRDKNPREAHIAFDDAMSKPNPNPELFKLFIDDRLSSADYLSVIGLFDQHHQTGPLLRLLDEGRWTKLQTSLDFASVDAGLEESQSSKRFVWKHLLKNDATALSQFRQRNADDLSALMFSLYDANKNGDASAKSSLIEAIKSREFPSADVKSFVVGQALHLVTDFSAARESYAGVSATSQYRLQAELYAGLATSELIAERNAASPASAGQLARQSTRRLQAIMKLRRAGRDDLSDARQLLQSLVAAAPADVDDRVLLSACLERLGDPQGAKEELLAVVEAAPTAQYLATLVDFLLRMGDNDEAQVWIDQLEEQAGWHGKTVSLRARWMAATNRQKEIPAFVELYAKQRLGRSPREIPKEMRQIAEIYRDAGMIDHAKRWLSLLAARFPDQSEPLSLLLIENDETERAIQRCVTQLTDSPTAETAALLARILVYGEVSGTTLGNVTPLLEQSLERFADNPSLLFAMGNLRLKLGDRESAIELLNRVTEVQPGHYLAWNNLAAMLAEEDGRENEAMETIERAISYAAYDIPTLMDTKAVVLMHQERYQDAADLLQRKVTQSRSASDPRFFFHLAMSLDKLDEEDAATDALAEADDLDLQNAFLTEFEEEELKRLRDKLSR